MNKLDRPGIFKARPLSLGVQCSDQSQSVACVIEYLILAQLDGEEWVDWSGFADHNIFGYHYVVKKDGQINQSGVDQIVKAMDWDGNIETFSGEPPDTVVQINVREETYNGKSALKVAWLNPGDYVPGGTGSSPELVKAAQAQFGSLLRAAAAASRPKAAAPAKAKTAAPPKAKPAPAAVQTDVPWDTEPQASESQA